MFLIDTAVLKRLADPDADTRVAALKQIISILNNNIAFHDDGKKRAAASEELSVVNWDILVRHLIKWFNFRPIMHESDVFDLLILIFSRRDLLRHVVKQISVSRLIREVQKICKQITTQENLMKLQNISSLLNDYDLTSGLTIRNDFSDESQSSSEINTPDVSQFKVPSKPKNISSEESLKITTPVSNKCDTIAGRAEEFWEKLEDVNLDTFNGLDAEMSLFLEPSHLRNVLKFLSFSLNDFPPEFFVQPPNILNSLVKILQQVPGDDAIEVTKYIRFIVNGLKNRWLDSLSFSTNTNQTFISMKKSINNILRTLTDFFKRLHETFNDSSFKHQTILNETYMLLFDLAAFIGETQNACKIFLNELMNIMAKFAKDLRLSRTRDDAGLTRLNYMICIYVINAFASSINTHDISVYCENNLWEFECDVALLDGALMVSQSSIYELIIRNRKNVIKEDADLTLLLNTRKTWSPVVKLFKQWEKLSDENIIFLGLEAIGTIRINRSLELVELLMNAIGKCENKFLENRKLEEAAEEIYLRLLSIEIPEIRHLAYAIARKHVQNKLQDDNEQSKQGASLCSIIGIPLTTEIVTEFLCFGFIDSDELIYQHVKLILFALLRSKVILAAHWLRLLEVMKPILPMMTALYSIDATMGRFVIEIYNQHSGFDDMELDQSLARFLFSSAPQPRNIAKAKLLERYHLDELIKIVPDDFCVLPEKLVTQLEMPHSRIGFDIETYANTCEILKTVDRNNIDLMKTILIQLSIMMNSRDLCEKSHDDNLWVFFMSSLDMGFPNDSTIRKLTINILFRWVVCIPTFRIYLANEPMVLEFLVKTLIYFQDDSEIKKKSACLLFLLLFSDFIVTTENSISMPRFISSLCCPFRFDQHWTQSPFNQITDLEQLNEVMDVNRDALDIREISQKFMKFTFALEWFKNEKPLVELENLNNESYKKGSNSIACENLQMTSLDIVCIKQSTNSFILGDICNRLDNTMYITSAQELIVHMQSLLLLPIGDEEGFADVVDRKIERLTVFTKTDERQQKMFIGFLQIYQRIMPWMADVRIVNVFCKKFIKCIICTNDDFPDDAYIEGLNLINCVVKLCRQRPYLMQLMLTSYERQEKVFLPSRLVERMRDHLFNTVMRDGKWHEAYKRPIVKSILTVLHSVLNNMTIQLDDKFLNQFFYELLAVPLMLYSSRRKHLKAQTPLYIYSSLLKQLFAVMLRIASCVGQLEIRPELYQSLFPWAIDENRRHKALPLLIIAEITKKKENYIAFCQRQHDFWDMTLLDFVLMPGIQTTKKQESAQQEALISILGNIIDHSDTKIDSRSLQTVITKLLQTNSITAMSYLIRKMVQNDHPAALELVIQNHLILSFLKHADLRQVGDEKTYRKMTDLLETVVVCYKHKPLKEHVDETVANNATTHFIAMLPGSKIVKENFFKKFNLVAFDLMLILMQSETGLLKICRTLNQSSIINRVMFASHDNLRITNSHAEIMFQLEFWNSLIDASLLFNCPAMDLISSHILDVSLEKCFLISASVSDDKAKFKSGTILEKQFHHSHYAIDLLFMQVVSIFDFVYSSKFSVDYKHSLTALCFLIIKKLTSRSERCQELADDIDLMSVVSEKLEMSLSIMRNYRHLETTKKKGIGKVQFMIKDLAIFLKALTEWNLSLIKNATIVNGIFKQLVKVTDWIDADSVLANCFLNFLQVISVMEVGRNCIMQEIDGQPLLKIILKKTRAHSVKLPHTKISLALMRNGIATLQYCSQMVEVRMILNNSKIFQFLEVLHPQMQKTRKTTWDEVTIEWLHFFEYLSRFEDIECTPHVISLFCRLFRLGNPTIKRISLNVIRNFSLKASIGHVILSSDDFRQTFDAILMESSDAQEKILILQTLLSIASNSEQLKAKLKNSSLNRKLKEQLSVMQSDAKFQLDPENVKILNLTSMLSQFMYPEN